jgi:hypothetical protein
MRTALAALSGKSGDTDDRHTGQRRADALIELARMAMKPSGAPRDRG